MATGWCKPLVPEHRHVCMHTRKSKTRKLIRCSIQQQLNIQLKFLQSELHNLPSVVTKTEELPIADKYNCKRQDIFTSSNRTAHYYSNENGCDISLD